MKRIKIKYVTNSIEQGVTISQQFILLTIDFKH